MVVKRWRSLGLLGVVCTYNAVFDTGKDPRLPTGARCSVGVCVHSPSQVECRLLGYSLCLPASLSFHSEHRTHSLDHLPRAIYALLFTLHIPSVSIYLLVVIND